MQRESILFYPLDLTDTDSDTLESRFVRVTPFYSPPVDVAPPEEKRGLVPFVPDAFSEMGGLSLVRGGRVTTISQETHEELLQESLEEYEDIWRSLAKK